MVIRTGCAVALWTLVSFGSTNSYADVTPPKTEPSKAVAGASETSEKSELAAPRVHHAPPSVAKARTDLAIETAIDDADKVQRAVLVYAPPQGQTVEVPFRRSSSGDKRYVATIPAADAVSPRIGYAIELDLVDGTRSAAFASRTSMHHVALEEDATDARERALLAAAGGRRSTLAASADYVHFGTTPAALTASSPGQGPAATTVRDQFYRLEGQFTYRLFRTVAEFGFRGGIVRGSSPVPRAVDRSQYDVGMNYGAPRVRLRLADWFHVDAEAMTSVNEVGYSLGGGGALLFGDPYATHFTLGFEGIRVFGVRGYSRLDVAVARRVTVGTLVEITTQPHADTAGVRLAGNVNVDLGAGFGIGLRGGYQARDFASGGPSLGSTVAYSF